MGGIETFAARVRSLPVMSPVLKRIETVLDNRESTLHDIAAALGEEPVIAARVMRLANSAYVGMPRTVSSLHNALVLLGTKRVKTLVMSISALSSFAGRAGELPLDLGRFRRHCAVAGMIAESLSRHLRRYVAVDADQAFAAAVIHDIGKLALAAFEPNLLRGSVGTSVSRNVPFWTAESGPLTHVSAGELLGGHWNFPPELIAAIRHHHQPHAAGGHTNLVYIVNLADCMAHALGYTTWENEPVVALDERALDVVKLPLERLKVIAETVVAREAELEMMSEVLA